MNKHFEKGQDVTVQIIMPDEHRVPAKVLAVANRCAGYEYLVELQTTKKIGLGFHNADHIRGDLRMLMASEVFTNNPELSVEFFEKL